MKLSSALLAILLPFAAHAQVTVSGGAAGGALPQTTVAGLPTCDASTQGSSRVVTDATNATSCTVGGGTDDNTCDCIDGVWTLRGTTATVADGDKGDITISGGTWGIDTGVVVADDIATDAVGSPEIAADAVGTSEIAADGVSASELNATGVEAELEAVMDLQDMQGAVTDAQVPDTITVNEAAGLNASGARLPYDATLDCFFDDVDDDGSQDDGEGCLQNGDRISGSWGAAAVYYASDFATGSSTAGIQEVHDHCAATLGGKACIALLSRGIVTVNAQIRVTRRGFSIVGAHGSTGSATGSGTTLTLGTALTTANSDCSGEEVLGGIDDTSGEQNCAMLLIADSYGSVFQGFTLDVNANAHVGIEFASRQAAGSNPNSTPTEYTTSGVRVQNVNVNNPTRACYYHSDRDNASANRNDEMILEKITCGGPTTWPKVDVYVNNRLTTHIVYRNSIIPGAYTIAGFNLRGGEVTIDRSSGGTSGTASTNKRMFAFCDDNLADMVLGTCTDASFGNKSRIELFDFHGEINGGHGDFFVNEVNISTLKAFITNSTFTFRATPTSGQRFIRWNAPGMLSVRDSNFHSEGVALGHAIDIDCDVGQCASQLGVDLIWDGNRVTPGDAALSVDETDNVVRWHKDVAWDRGTPFVDSDVDKVADQGEGAFPACYERTVMSPTASTDVFLHKMLMATGFTVEAIHCIVTGTTSIPVTVQECAADGTTCGETEAAITCDADGAAHSGAMTDAAIDQNDWMKLDFAAPTGTPDSVTVQVCGH